MIEGTLSGTYNYEIVNGEFVIYKDGVLVTDIEITKVDDVTYTISGGVLDEATVLVKVEGEQYALTGFYQAYTETELAYGITFVPGFVEDEETTGYIVIEDNNNGTVGGTYTYEIVDGAFVIYKDDVVTDEILVIKNIDGTYLFQCVGIVPQLLVKVEGMSVLLEGTYNVNGATDALYVVTFTPCIIEKEPVYVEEGTLEIIDNNAQSAGGSYTYKITDDGEIRIFKDGERVSDIFITIGLDGSYMFQCQGMTLAQTLIKVKGEYGMLSGGYRVVDGETVKYELLFLKDGYELPVPQDKPLVMGDNTIVVNDAVTGTKLTYTFDAAGDITITPINGESNVELYIVINGRELEISLSNKLGVAAGQTLVIVVRTADGTIDEIEFNVTFQKKQSVDLEDDEF